MPNRYRIAGCGTWHLPSYADGIPTDEFQADHAVAGGGVFRPFEEGNESWAELVVRTSQAIMDIAHRHRGSTAVLLGHTETVSSAFHTLAAQPLYLAFDLKVAPASVTEWTADDDPTGWPPPRWTLWRFSSAC
jgi:2,3-bisphosphoglycerate-dependent phosphoglycerate mutase